MAGSLFLAIEVGPAVRSSLASLLGRLAALGPQVRPVRQDGLHLTVHFLGGVAPEGKESVRARARRVAQASSPFLISLEGIGLFPDERSARVIWAAVGRGGEELERLASRAATALAEAGWTRPDRPFRAHCTLARLTPPLSRVVSEELARIRELAAREPPLMIPVDALVLLESVPVLGGPNHYQRRGRWLLGGG